MREGELTKADMHRNTHGTLDRPADVIAVPSNTLRDVRIDSSPVEKTTSILDVRVLGRDQHDQADDCRDAESDHENASGLELIGGEATSDAQEAGDNVWRDGHQLGLFVAVAQCLNDSW